MAAPVARRLRRFSLRPTSARTQRAPRPFRRKLLFQITAALAGGGLGARARAVMESASRPGAGDPASAAERPGLHPGPASRASVARSTFPGAAPPAALGGGQPETHSRVASKSQIPQRSKEVELYKALNSTGPENELYKTTKQRQMKTKDPIKKNIKKSYKPLSQQKAEEELKEKNQLLEAVNKQLHVKLTESQEEVKVLTQRVELLEKSQDSYLEVFGNGNIDPGKQILGNQQETMKREMESALVFKKLKDQLKHFNQITRKRMEELQVLKAKLKIDEEERARFLQKQEAFNSEKDELTVTIERMKQMLAIWKKESIP